MLVNGNEIIPGADSLIAQLMEQQREYLVPTKNSSYTFRDLAYCLSLVGLDIPAHGYSHPYWRLPISCKASAQQSAFFVGKPNPLMMRSTLNFIDVQFQDIVMFCDHMDMNILVGVESDIRLLETLTPDKILN